METVTYGMRVVAFNEGWSMCYYEYIKGGRVYSVRDSEYSRDGLLQEVFSRGGYMEGEI